MAQVTSAFVQALRNAGLDVVEMSGWQSRGESGSFNVRGILLHHDAMGLKNDNVPNYMKSNGVSGSQVWIKYTGQIYILAAGLKHHAGAGRGFRNIPANGGNAYCLGIETDYSGSGPRDARIDAAIHVFTRVAVLHYGLDPQRDLALHKEYAPDRKIDLSNFDADAWRHRAGSGSTQAPGTAPKVITGDTYTVKAGDTLSRIAAAAGTTWQKLAEINGINPDNINEGQVIRLKAAAPAPAPTPPPVPAGPTYTVKAGDTLSRIAAANGTTWQELAKYNNIANPDDINEGRVLGLPPKSLGYHQVAAGETLSSIAAKYGTTWKDLAGINSLANPDAINEGQVLKVPGGSPTPPAPPAPAPSANTYTVVAGDTLSAISRKTGRSVQDLISRNSIANPDDINEGQVLNLGDAPAAPAPAPEAQTYTVVLGDTLSAISRKTGKSVADLVVWNVISNPDDITEGQVLKLSGTAIIPPVVVPPVVTPPVAPPVPPVVETPENRGAVGDPEANYRAGFAAVVEWCKERGKEARPYLYRLAFAVQTESNGYRYGNDAKAFHPDPAQRRPGWDRDDQGNVLSDAHIKSVYDVLRRSLTLGHDTRPDGSVGNNGGSTGWLQQLSKEYVAARFPGKTWGWGSIEDTLDIRTSTRNFLDALTVTDQVVYDNGGKPLTLSSPIARDVLATQRPLVSEASSSNYGADRVALAVKRVDTWLGADVPPLPAAPKYKLLVEDLLALRVHDSQGVECTLGDILTLSDTP